MGKWIYMLTIFLCIVLVGCSKDIVETPGTSPSDSVESITPTVLFNVSPTILPLPTLEATEEILYPNIKIGEKYEDMTVTNTKQDETGIYEVTLKGSLKLNCTYERDLEYQSEEYIYTLKPIKGGEYNIPFVKEYYGDNPQSISVFSNSSNLFNHANGIAQVEFDEITLGITQYGITANINKIITQS